MAVALPYWLRERLQVNQSQSRINVSEVNAIVRRFAELFLNISTVPTGYATFAFESIVNVRLFASEAGWMKHLPLSDNTVV